MSGLPLLGPTDFLAHRNGRLSLSLSHTHVHARLVCLHKKNRKGWANNEINGVVRFRFLCRGRVGRRGGSSTHANVNAEQAFTRSRKTLFARTVKRDAQVGSSLIVNHFSPSAFSRRLVAGKSLFSFVPLPSTQTSEHKRCCTLLVRVPPRSRGSKCLGGRGFFVRFGDTTRTAAASLLSAERLLSHGGAHLVSSPRSHLRATTGQDGKSTEPPSHGASAFPPLWGQNFARESG